MKAKNKKRKKTIVDDYSGQEEFAHMHSGAWFDTLVKISEEKYPTEIKIGNYYIRRLFLDDEDSHTIYYKGMPIVSHIHSPEAANRVMGIPFKEDQRHITASEYIDQDLAKQMFFTFTRIHNPNILLLRREVQKWSDSILNYELHDYGHKNGNEGLPFGTYVQIYDEVSPMWAVITNEQYNNQSPYVGQIVSSPYDDQCPLICKGDSIYIYPRNINTIQDEEE